MTGRNIGVCLAIIASIYFIYENRQQIVKSLVNKQFLWKILISIVMQIPAVRNKMIGSIIDTRSSSMPQ